MGPQIPTPYPPFAMPNSNSRMVKPSPNGAHMISTKRVGTTQAPRSRGVDKVVTQTQLVGKDTLTSMCTRCEWTLQTEMRSEVASTRRKQERRHAEGVREHEAESHDELQRVKPSSLPTRWPVSRDGHLNERCSRCFCLTRTSCIESTAKAARRQHKRHAEKVKGHLCRDSVPEPPKRPLPVIGLLEVDVLNRHSTDAQRRLARLRPDDRVKDTEGATVYAYTPASAGRLLRMLALHSGARLLYVGCGWGEIFLAWAIAWGASCAFEQEAGNVLLDVHAIDLVPSAIGIFQEALLGLGASGVMRASVVIQGNTFLIGGSLRLVVRPAPL